MEYFIGSIVMLAIIVALRLLSHKFFGDGIQKVNQSQTYIHNLIGPYMLDNEEMRKPIVSQTTKHLDKMFVRVVITDDKAYWIQDNIFYVADCVDGDVDKSTAQEVDTMAMDRVQLNKIMLVVEKLREGAYDDSWDAGKS